MRRITHLEAEEMANLPELRRFQLGPMQPMDDVAWVDLSHHRNSLIIEHNDCIGIFHPAPFDGVVFLHHIIPPWRWGPEARQASKAGILEAFNTIEPRPARMVGWTLGSNRLSVAFAKRLGFQIDGFFPHGRDHVVMLGASECQVAAAEV